MLCMKHTLLLFKVFHNEGRAYVAVNCGMIMRFGINMRVYFGRVISICVIHYLYG